MNKSKNNSFENAEHVIDNIPLDPFNGSDSSLEKVSVLNALMSLFYSTNINQYDLGKVAELIQIVTKLKIPTNFDQIFTFLTGRNIQNTSERALKKKGFAARALLFVS